MKLNQELIDKLDKGEIQLQHTGTVEQLNEILKSAAPGDKYNASGTSKYYGVNNSGEWVDKINPDFTTPIYTTEQFYHVPNVGKMDTETRELAKQLFVHTGAGAGKCITLATDFIKLLNEQL